MSSSPSSVAVRADSMVAKWWLRLGGTTPGRWLFSRLVCLRAPYFGSISPVMRELRPGHAAAAVKKRRRVLNHIGTVHALAMGNLCEFVAGLVLEMTVAPTQRWIPRGMTIRYLKKATSDIQATACIDIDLVRRGGDCVVEVAVVDRANTLVVEAEITMYVSDRVRQDD